MNYTDQLKTWLSDSLKEDIPSDVVAFSFNLMEPAGIENVKFGIELVGTSSFDSEDPDWACDEIWNPEIRAIGIPEDFSSPDWETCHTKMKDLVSQLIDSDTSLFENMKQLQGVGIGFVDGDLDIIWKP
jgi:shikimate kinase